MNCKKYYSQRKGFTLIEIITVIAILGIVTSAITSVFLFTQRSYNRSNKQYEAQSQSRNLINTIKSEIGFAVTITLYDSNTTPTMEANKGYIYSTNDGIAIKRPGSSEQLFFTNDSIGINPIIYFTPKSSSPSSFNNVVQVTIETDVYLLKTDIYIQNLSGFIELDTTMEDDPSLDKWPIVEYTLP